ncbi:monovalent cation/H+ antiporter subunit E [Halobacteria archaeon AArc-m2/3/4]|uniref:Monovalent cation/H+ antiporter subunit E n=1 Tax=Natronoglomus mannanivorans TaxID=2979990 RepID=A0AAP3E331_9EURY|nr:monovalent cation/H+ antiporter subunit E [Halobacteria archaeon AArc-xg1-1]MCU4974123.1 monovalent cation/H+ antiporter subunit E [Halobacteria archaeon AArc-m2/3/4]
MADRRVLVPLSESVTVRQTVSYAVQTALADDVDPAEVQIHLVVAVPYEADLPEGQDKIEFATSLLERAAAWVREDAGSHSHSLTIETEIVGDQEYLFGPRDYAKAFAAYADEHDLECVILDPEYQPGATAPMLQPLERELDRVGLRYDEAPVERSARHERLVGPGSRSRLFAMFLISYGFYLTLGDPTYTFDLVTGAAVAGIVAVTLSHVTFTTAPTLVGSPLRVVRFTLYIPYLIWEIIRANLAISLVILRPSMPIDPKLTRVNARVRSGLPLLALANSITLTPGTLTVRANNQQLIVHSLTQVARDDLFEGSLERAVRFVFYGREAAATATPKERGDAEVIGGEEL